MVTLEGIVLWNNQPDREAFGLVRKGVGQSTVLRAVETPYPKVNPIQSNPMIVHWPTAFLPKHSAHRVGRVIPEKNHPHGRSRSNPTIVQYSDFGKEVAQVNTVSHPVGAWVQKK